VAAASAPEDAGGGAHRGDVRTSLPPPLVIRLPASLAMLSSAPAFLEDLRSTTTSGGFAYGAAAISAATAPPPPQVGGQ
jgi:hypothetical protein